MVFIIACVRNRVMVRLDVAFKHRVTPESIACILCNVQLLWILQLSHGRIPSDNSACTEKGGERGPKIKKKKKKKKKKKETGGWTKGPNWSR